VDSSTATGSERDRAQLQGVFSRRVHHLEESSSIWKEEKESGKKGFWVFFVWPRAPSLAYSKGFYSIILFTGAWYELERRRAHCRLRNRPFGGSVLHHSA
jgi:hypothetical protein